MASSPITSWQIDGETMQIVPDFIFLGSKITSDGDSRHEIKRRLLLGRKAMTTRQNIKMLRNYFSDKGSTSQSYDFCSSHVWMWELNHKERWALKNWYFWTELYCNHNSVQICTHKIQLCYINLKMSKVWLFFLKTFLIKIQFHFSHLHNKCN